MSNIVNNSKDNLGTMGGNVSKGIDTATSIAMGIINGDITGGLAGASAPWIAEEIKKQAGDNETARLVAHAILGAVVAELQGNSGLAGGAGAVGGEIAADIIRKAIYAGKDVKDLTEAEKQNISALAQLAAGLATAAGGGDAGDVGTAISSSKNAVENNSLLGDYIREEHKGSVEYWKDQVRETVGENTISQITNGVLIAYGDTVDLGVGVADTVLDAVLALSSCTVGASYCDTAMNDLKGANQTVYDAMGAIGSGAVWDSFINNLSKAIDGDQKALEEFAGVLSSVLVPSKIIAGNAGKTGGVVNKVDDLIPSSSAINKVENGVSDANKTFINEKIYDQLKTEPDSAFFWSGKTDGIGGAEIAADIAHSKSGVTLESYIKSKGIEMPEWDFNNPSSIKAWEEVSAAYAQQVKGEVKAVVGQDLRVGNIWENIELPRLKENPNVTKIIVIDPKTKVETIIFERGK